jgi:membrane fusion protein (multidrug efflux system)
MTTDLAPSQAAPVRGAGAAPGPTTEAAKAPASKRRFILLGALALAAAGGGTYYSHARHFEDTDDAQIDGEITNVSPRVAGTLVSVKVRDNQVIKAGDLVAEIDPVDFEVAVAQARAQLAQAEAVFRAENPSVSMTETSNETGLSAAEADVASAESGLLASDREIKQLTAQLDLARANEKNAQQEKARAEELHKTGAVSQAELDSRTNALDAASANVAAVTASLAAAQARASQAQARITSARSHVTELRQNAPRELDVRKATVGAREAQLELAKAQLRQAELNLGYVKIVAPVGGIVGRKSMSVGDRVAPGQQIMAIARVDDLWVTANFRETQVRDMRPGQEATLHVDALDLELHGAVESIGGATGSRFSLFPPENASGNFVKVVQRIPVRIKLEPGQPGMDRLRPGMSVEPEVRVR